MHRLSRQEGLTLAAALALGLLLGAPSLAEDEGSVAYVNTTALNLRAAPGTGGAKVSILLLYDPVIILDRRQLGSETWYQVEAGGGYTEGWLSGSYLAFGNPPPGAIPQFDGDYGEPRTPSLVPGKFQYVGVQACRECHEESTGDFDKGAVEVWEGHDHAEAWHTLQRDYTRQIAHNERGVDDPAHDWRCLKCHVTAYGADPAQLAPTYEEQEGVTCEACHGPGGSYAQEDHGPSNPDRASLGFRIARDLDERNELCTSCHNPASPTYKPFNLREYSRSIAHWVDRGDEAYYAAFHAEAERRKARVDAARERALQEEVAQQQAAGPPEAPEVQEPVETARAEPAPEAEAAKPPEPEAAKPPEPEAPPAPPMQAQETPTPAPALEKPKPPPAPAPEEPKPPPAPAPEAPAPPKAAAEPVETAAAESEQQRQAQKIALQAARLRLQQQEAAEQERRKHEAEVALAQQKQHESEQAAARKQVEQKKKKAASASSGMDRYLKEVDDKLILNKNGKKYKTVEFSHLAHASQDYVPGIQCVTCHHQTEDDEKPEGCHTCHEVGGDADETSQKWKAMHSKQNPFPMEPDQEGVSCYACHKAQNALLKAGKRKGDEAPTKCTGCHAKKAG